MLAPTLTSEDAVQAIEQLGQQIEAEYAAAQYDSRALPQIACAALRAAAPHRWFSLEHMIRWYLCAPQVPAQGREASFGEPPLTLFVGRRFFIEALTWMDGTTSIHRHGFSGAFSVMQGGSLHTQYRFAVRQVVNQHLQLGALHAAEPELLRVGDTRAIVSGDGLVHSLFHLERPSVTLVVRSYFDPDAAPQLTYWRPGVALDPFYRDDRLPRLQQLLTAAYQARLPERAMLAREFLQTADLHSSILVLQQLLGVAADETTALVELVMERHGALASELPLFLAEQQRERQIVHWRKEAHAPAHRLLLALVLNVDDREQILRLVREEFPGADPIELIVKWVGEMSPPSQPGAAAHALSYELGELELRVFRDLLLLRSEEQILASLAQELDLDGQEAEVRQLCAALRVAPPFRPLLRPGRWRAERRPALDATRPFAPLSPSFCRANTLCGSSVLWVT